VACTENDYFRLIEPMSKASWQRNCRNVEFFNNHGKFTALLGYEFTREPIPELKDTYNCHRCVLFPGKTGKIYSWYNMKTPTVRALAKKFQNKRVLLNHHHRSGVSKENFSDQNLERSIEICSGWFNNMQDEDYQKKLHQILHEGVKLGFFGAGDNHERNPGLNGGLTGVWATENSQEAIFNGFYNRRTFATTGLRPDLRFSVSGTFMGGETKTNKPPIIEAFVKSEESIREIEVIRDGKKIYSKTQNSEEAYLNWTDSSCTIGEHYYYIHVLFEGKEHNFSFNVAQAYGIHAWSSPVWIKKTI
jgi:hypothetical protein